MEPELSRLVLRRGVLFGVEPVISVELNMLGQTHEHWVLAEI
jgi:hypothetical protein